MSAKSDPRVVRNVVAEDATAQRRPEPAATDARFYYRRPIGVRELLPAIGVGVAAGLVAYYLARVFLQRTPLVTDQGRASRLGETSRIRVG